MKPISVLLSIACFCATAFSAPTQDPPTDVSYPVVALVSDSPPDAPTDVSFPAVAPISTDSHLNRPTEASSSAAVAHISTDSPTNPPTEVSFPAATPASSDFHILPTEIFLGIISRLNSDQRHLVAATNKEFRKLFQKWPAVELKDVEMIKNSLTDDQAFYRAIIKQDNDVVRRLLKRRFYTVRLEGLQLALRYNNPQAAWIFLAHPDAESLKSETEKKLREDAERRLTPVEKADLEQFRELQIRGRGIEIDFFNTLIWNFPPYHLPRILSGAERVSGLQLAVRYGDSNDIFVWLAFGGRDSDSSEDVKAIVDAAKGKLLPTELAYLDKIHNSEPWKKELFQDLVAKRSVSLEELDRLLLDEDAAILGLQLAVHCGRISIGEKLLDLAQSDLKKKLFRAGAAASYFDKCEDCKENWKEIHALRRSTISFLMP